MTRVVTFTEKSVYDLGNPNQQDHNKLFGLGYFDGFHHTDSARFGWYWDPGQSKMVLTAYCYVSGERIYSDLCAVELNTPHICTISFAPGEYRFSVTTASGVILGSAVVPHTHTKKFSYQLRLYFGGDQTAPTDLSLEMTHRLF